MYFLEFISTALLLGGSIIADAKDLPSRQEPNHSQERLGPHDRPKSLLKPNHHKWTAPGKGDARSPCPLLNTLANHEFLPHDGRNISLEKMKQAMKDGVNVGAELTEAFFGIAVKANPDGGDTVDIDMLYIHNFIEHDGSLSRLDSVFSPLSLFDEPTFDNFLSYFNDSLPGMDIAATANARARHAYDLSRKNPNFSITGDQIGNLLTENAMLLATFGHPDRPIADRKYYEFFFRNEKLPVDLGWEPPDAEVGPTLNDIVAELEKASPSGVPVLFNPRVPQL